MNIKFWPLLIFVSTLHGQPVIIKGYVTDGVLPLQGVEINVEKPQWRAKSNAQGRFEIPVQGDDGEIWLRLEKMGYIPEILRLFELKNDTLITIQMAKQGGLLSEVVISATLQPLSRSEAVVPVEVLYKKLAERISTPHLMDLLPALPGIRLQNSCNVCQAPGLQLNGLPGPYTLLLIDGMPLMGPLSSTYGLFGFPTNLMRQVEISRGPGSVLYGSEAIGGIINVLTPDPDVAPKLQFEQEASTWGEFTTQALTAYRKNDWRMLTGISTHLFNYRIDRNDDQFMDIPLQRRLSIFQKAKYLDQWDIYLRYYYEDRLGGEMKGQHFHRHTRESYVESIFTNRLEWTMKYKSNKLRPLSVWWNASAHDQNSVYGEETFLARQYLAQAQILWQESKGAISYTTGASARYQYYNDNTTATNLLAEGQEEDAPEIFLMPGFFGDFTFQNSSIGINAGSRADYHPVHGFIPTYRLGLLVRKGFHSFRLYHGSAFRVVNLFAEEHAALTGAREVVVVSGLKPERSVGTLAEWEASILRMGYSIRVNAGGFFNVFLNRILPDYDTDPQKIIFDNLQGSFRQAGFNGKCEVSIGGRWDASIGGSIQHVGEMSEDGTIEIPPFVERYSIQTMAGYSAGKWRVDISSFTYGPMRLPLAGELDPRPEYSPVFTHMNAQISVRLNEKNRLTVGGRNLLDFVPWKSVPFLIARANDPFDDKVVFDTDGNPVPTPDNPYALTFDPGYSYTSLQGRRFFVQWNYTF